MSQHQADVARVAIGLLWLAAAGILGLAALLSTIVSQWLYTPLGAWAVAIAALAFRLQGAAGAGSHRAAAVIGAGSCGVAAALAVLTPGAELMWAVVLLCGLASLYSLLLTRRTGHA